MHVENSYLFYNFTSITIAPKMALTLNYSPTICKKSGTKNRCTKSTDYNDTSSRSHAILQLSFELEKQIESGQTMLIRSKLSFADLAGNEKMSMSESVSDSRHIKEMTSINQSLSTLGNVISALSSKKPHVPYRESKLTRILQVRVCSRRISLLHSNSLCPLSSYIFLPQMPVSLMNSIIILS
jgi:Kinesin motor domain